MNRLPSTVAASTSQTTIFDATGQLGDGNDYIRGGKGRDRVDGGAGRNNVRQ